VSGGGAAIAARTRTVVGHGDALRAVLVVAAGTAVLAARPLASFGEDARIAWYVASYVAIAAAAIAAPLPPAVTRPSSIRRTLAIAAVGIAGVALAGVAGGPPVPAPTMAIAAPVSVLAAVAEEALYRRLGYAWLERWGAASAVVVPATVFALVHLPAYGVTAFPVDLGAGLLFGWQRWASGSWLAPAGTHAVADILASLR
jgi:membrane protease YdiL (CAAX protease family)